MRQYVIEEKSQKIIDVIIVDPDHKPIQPDGLRLSDTGGNIGDVWDGTAWVAPLPDLADLAFAVRGRRAELLAASDWTQALDAPVDRAAWASYRQALRDISNQVGFPLTIDWPAPPT